jgi:two-component system, LytTR family, response regulator
MIKALIVDDEQTQIDLLKWLIGSYCPDIGMVKTSRSVQEALSILQFYEPDILFLDIRMPHQNGFDLLKHLEKWNFEIVFTTAYDEYAIRAVRVSAFDYLLKPIDVEDLVKTIERFKIKSENKPGKDQFVNFLDNIKSLEKGHFKLALRTNKGVKYLTPDQVIRLQAERNYTCFHLVGSKTILISKTLKEYEEILRPYHFIRIHKSHLINSDYFDRYDHEGWLYLTDGTKVEVSRRRSAYFSKPGKS